MTFATTHTPSADVWATHYATDAGLRWWPAEELVRFAARRGALGDVLEVGCGNGANLWFLAERARRVVGVDIYAGALALARGYADRRAAQGRPDGAQQAPVALACGSAARLPFGDASFDGVCDLMVSQHLPWSAHVPLYREYRRVLRPGGWLFLYHLSSRTTGGSEAVLNHARLDLFPNAGLTCLPSPERLVGAVRWAGFAVEAPRGMAREYPDGATAHYTVLEGTAHV